MEILNFDEWMQMSENEKILPSTLVDQITEDIVEGIFEQNAEIDDIVKYLFENYGIELDIELFLDDINEAFELDEADVAPAPAPDKPSFGQKVKGHFKKHWKKYAAGAAGLAAVGGAAYLGHKKGYKKGHIDGHTAGHTAGRKLGYGQGQRSMDMAVQNAYNVGKKGLGKEMGFE